MGLDMYFEKHHVKLHERGQRHTQTIEVFDGGYFRKFNALHGWIVDNCADGVDNCKSVEIRKEELKELFNVLTLVHENHDLADELLPLTDGFFFGNRRDEEGNLIKDYDEYYFSDVAEAITVVKELIEWLEQPQESRTWYEVVYRASW